MRKGLTISNKSFGIAMYWEYDNAYLHCGNRYYSNIKSIIQAYSDMKKMHDKVVIFHNHQCFHPNYRTVAWKINKQ